MHATHRIRPSRRLQIAGIAVAVALTALWLASHSPFVQASGACANFGWILYENSNQTGDATKVCSPTLIPYNAQRSNFANLPGTLDLSNGCASTFGNNSTWNDCASAVDVVSLPSGAKFVLYANSGYSTPAFCADANGTHSYSLAGTLANDVGSSARIISGDC